MIDLGRSLITVACLAAAGLGAGCAPMVDQRGWRPDPEAVGTIRPGVDNKNSVAKLLGTPSSTSNFSDNDWYYVSQTTRSDPFEMEKSTDQSVTVVQFDTAGNVTGVNTLGADAGEKVAMNSGVTPFLGTNASLWQELFGNIGRFNAPGNSALPSSSMPGGPTGSPP